MSRPLIIEQLSVHGDVLQRHRFTHLPIRIGRAYDNDLILDDPHTGAHHAEITQNQLDELIITDLGSLNGITQGRQRNEFFVVDSEVSYRLGNTRLRIRTADHPVAPEQMNLSRQRPWDDLLPAALGLGALLVVGVLTAWLRDLDQGNLGKYLLELVGTLGFALGWSGIWAVFSNLFNGQARFGRHLLIVGLGMSAVELWEYLSGWVAYAFSWESLAHFSLHPIMVIVAVTLYFHLRTAGSKRLGRIKIYLAAFALAGIAIAMIKQYQLSHHLGNELYLSRLYPPALRLSGDMSTADFMANIHRLQPIVDDKRKETTEKETAEKETAEDQTSDQETLDEETSLPTSPSDQSSSSTGATHDD